MNKLSLLAVFFLLVFGSTHAQPIELLKEIRPGTTNPAISNFTVLNGKLYFVIDDSLHGSEIWMTDGTTAGTTLFADINPGIKGSNPANLKVIKNKLYFSANNGISNNLYISDGIPAHTLEFDKVADAGNFIGLKDKVYFYGTDTISGGELWVTDGSITGTHVVKNIYPGKKPSMGATSTIVECKERLYFAANDSVHSGELWISDGTETGTVMIKDLSPLPGSGVSGFVHVFKDKVYFIASLTGSGAEWWYTDGTDTGTHLLKDINPGSPSGVSTLYAINYNDRFYFLGFTNSYGYEWWSSDGTEAGTTMLKDINPAPASVGVSPGIVYKNKMFFSANDGTHGIELWSTDGTEAGTKMFIDIPGHVAGSRPSSLVVHNNKLYFAATDSINGVQLWMTNGVDTTIMLTKELPIYKNALPVQLYYGIFNKELYFNARYSNDTGVEVYVLRNPVPENIMKLPVVMGAKVYPNPVSDHITLEYSVSASTATSINLYDMSGKIVSTFISNEQRSAGHHTERLTLPSSLAPGIYKLRLQCDGTSTSVSIVK